MNSHSFWGGIHMEIHKIIIPTPYAVGDVNALTEAILYYIENPDKAEEDGRKARETLQSATLDKVYAEWKNYMEQVMLRA